MEKRKTIILDINDTIRAFTRQFLNCYKKAFDPASDMKLEDVTEFNLMSVFPFKDTSAYNKFRYTDYAYDIHCLAPYTNERLRGTYELWAYNTLCDFDEELVPNLVIASPLESAITIQSTLAWCSSHNMRQREYIFPVDSFKLWDKGDIIITANPNLIEAAPEGKVSIKIDMPYNTETEATYSFPSMLNLIHDEKEVIKNIIENNQ